jgi:hypothetical protein
MKENNNQIIEIKEEKTIVKNYSNDKSGNINFNYYHKKELNNKINERQKRRMEKKKELEEELFLSSKYTIYLFTIWLIFIITFISGFIVHYDTIQNVTASSIIWTFSSIICIFAVLYSYCYYKCLHAKNVKEIQKYLKYIPC